MLYQRRTSSTKWLEMENDKMAMYKLCSRCNKRIEYYSKCEDCKMEIEQDKREKTRQYDREIRYSKENKKYTDFYHSPAWINLSEVVKKSRHGLDIYAYYVEGKIEEATISHHLREIKKDGWEDRLVKERLIGLSHASHTKIHGMMENDYEGTIATLEGLMRRWDKEFG